jgi:16S rRNA processing protein RimM
MDEWLEVGTIVAPQGLKGELRVSPSSDFPERFEKPGQRWLQSPDHFQTREVKLLKGRYIPGKNVYVIQLAEIGDRDRAETLRGYKLLVPQSDRPQLEVDEYHVSDLIDLEVYNQITGKNIGIITNIFWAGNDLLEVQLHQQPTIEEIPQTDLSQISRISKRRKIKPKRQKLATVLIPFVKAIVPVVDINGKRIEIQPPPGLLEVNDRERSVTTE